MINYFSEARLSATVTVTGNLTRTLGIALCLFHAENARKIAFFEAGNDPEKHYAIAMLKVERDEFERWHRDLEKLVAYQRDSAAEFDANLTDVQRRAAA